MKNKILLLTLKTFSATGGIETVCKCLGKALNESVMNNLEDFSIHSLYDNNSDAYGNRYFPLNVFKGFDGHKLTYIFNSIIKAHKKDIVILSHVNLLPLGWMIKKISPKKKIAANCTWY